MHWMTKFVCTIAFSCLSVFSDAVGFRSIESDELVMGGIWYPSNTQEERQRLGPFDVTYALNGKVSEAKFQPILLSHGKLDVRKEYALPIKDIWLRPLQRNWKEILNSCIDPDRSTADGLFCKTRSQKNQRWPRLAAANQ